MTDGPTLQLDGRISELLAGKKIVLTGVTGFIGEQIAWKILTECPDTRLGVLVRPRGSTSARQRVIALVGKRIFADVRHAAGSAEALVDQRIDVIEGDLPGVPKLPRDIDVFIHCAGDVSFDPPIDDAFRTNVIGTRALLERLRESVTGPDGELTRTPHYVHISTAYTAGRRRGVIPEERHPHDVDVEAETAAAMAIAEHIEAESRTAARLTALRKEAEREHRPAGLLTTAAETERRRLEWVKERKIAAGTERARSLGWTDVYTFAKSMGERVVEELAADFHVSVVRPAIVESSLVHPHPGWIEGFKMADPILLAYGKGQLPEFPASPDAVIDIVPCDHVVNATLAVCATEPEPGVAAYYHVSSGARNPLTFAWIYRYIREYFQAHPLRPENPVELPEWHFPGAARVEGFLAAAENVHKVADRAMGLLPRGNRTRAWSRKLDKQGKQLSFLRKYLSLYSEYLQSELHFVDDRTLALHRSLHPDDVETWAFDTAAVDWHEYVTEIHSPSVTGPVRRGEIAKRRRRMEEGVLPTLRPSEDGKRVMAVFDMDGTVVATNVVETYLWARLPQEGLIGRARELASIAARVPLYLMAERTDRSTFLRALHRRYRGADVEELKEFVGTDLAAELRRRISPQALARIQEHRAVGHRTVLLTGALRMYTGVLDDLFDDVVASDLDADVEGRATGFLSGPPMVGDSRAAFLRHHARHHGIDLDASYAYADSFVDFPMLSTVGHPVAVNPDIGLTRAARARHWHVVDWAAHSRGVSMPSIDGPSITSVWS